MIFGIGEAVRPVMLKPLALNRAKAPAQFPKSVTFGRPAAPKGRNVLSNCLSKSQRTSQAPSGTGVAFTWS